MKLKFGFQKNNVLIVAATLVVALTLVNCGHDEATLSIKSITPKKGPVSGQTKVTITGAGFNDTTIVQIDNDVCGELKLISDTKIECLMPEHELGPVDIAISNEGGSGEMLEAAYTYECMPFPQDGIEIWANTGEDKVTQDELRANCDPIHRTNSAWDGNTITLFGARNEVVSFNLVIESSKNALNNVSVLFADLVKPADADGPAGSIRTSTQPTGNGVFDWTNRNIELFFVRYLQIKGLSLNTYSTYDERHIPARLRRKYTGDGTSVNDGKGYGSWTDRPDHDKYYPEIAVPLELKGQFNIAARNNQSIWADIYIPKNTPKGLYKGTVEVLSNGSLIGDVKVELKVRNFTLPDVPSSKTMVFLGYEDVSWRYLGVRSPDEDAVNGPRLDTIVDRHFQIAHRHKLALVDSNLGWTVWTQKRPRPSWEKRLDGSLFTSAFGYSGPGENVGNGIFSIGTYGSWDWRVDVSTLPDSQLSQAEIDQRNAAKQAMIDSTNAWEQWFHDNGVAIGNDNVKNTERFLYLIDESQNYPLIELWSKWMRENTGIGKNIAPFATVDLTTAIESMPHLGIPASWMTVKDKNSWQTAANTLISDPNRQVYLYNSFRPASGTFAIEDDGVALRELAWGQYKKKIDRWFYWQSTYYNDYQNSRGQTRVFQNAQTYGETPTSNSVLGMTGHNYSNGNGVLFYPGTDKIYASDSYNVDGPLVSLRMKHWRRGIQDVDYLTLAKAINPTRVQELVNAAIPKALWEYGSEPGGGSIHTNISWSTDPDTWEAKRKELADIIEAAENAKKKKRRR